MSDALFSRPKDICDYDRFIICKSINVNTKTNGRVGFIFKFLSFFSSIFMTVIHRFNESAIKREIHLYTHTHGVLYNCIETSISRRYSHPMKTTFRYLFRVINQNLNEKFSDGYYYFYFSLSQAKR